MASVCRLHELPSSTKLAINIQYWNVSVTTKNIFLTLLNFLLWNFKPIRIACAVLWIKNIGYMNKNETLLRARGFERCWNNPPNFNLPKMFIHWIARFAGSAFTYKNIAKHIKTRLLHSVSSKFPLAACWLLADCRSIIWSNYNKTDFTTLRWISLRPLSSFSDLVLLARVQLRPRWHPRTEEQSVVFRFYRSQKKATTAVLKGLFTRKSDFALGLQVSNANNIFLFSKMDWLTAKSHSEIRRVNK